MYTLVAAGAYNIMSSFRSTEDASAIIASGVAVGSYSGFKVAGKLSHAVSGGVGGLIVTTAATVSICNYLNTHVKKYF